MKARRFLDKVSNVPPMPIAMSSQCAPTTTISVTAPGRVESSDAYGNHKHALPSA